MIMPLTLARKIAAKHPKAEQFDAAMEVFVLTCIAEGHPEPTHTEALGTYLHGVLLNRREGILC